MDKSREKISICIPNKSKTSLIILDEKKLQVSLDESTMELFALYKGKKYQVQGSFILPYIVLEGSSNE